MKLLYTAHEAGVRTCNEQSCLELKMKLVMIANSFLSLLRSSKFRALQQWERILRVAREP